MHKYRDNTTIKSTEAEVSYPSKQASNHSIINPDPSCFLPTVNKRISHRERKRKERKTTEFSQIVIDETSESTDRCSSRTGE